MLVSATPATAPTSQVFDDFRLVRPLGQGGMGSVWLGHDTLLDRPVALKFLSNPEEGTQGRTRLLAEARALARVHHPNVAAVYRIGEVEGQSYIAYEYIDGVSLAQMMRPLPWRSVLEIGLGLARGLAAVHRQGVLHCDIKPANVVLTRAGEPKLIDFGIARVRRVRDLASDLAKLGAGALAEPTGSSTEFAGTPLYMAPELWQGHGFSEATDVYALGLVLHELLAGALSHRAVEGDDLIAYLATRELPHLGGLIAGVPAALADLIARLTAVGPAERLHRADVVVDGLEVIRSLYRNFTERQDDVDDDHARLLAHLQSLVDHGAEIGRHFYDSLFLRHPDLRPLFPPELAGQRRKLEGAIELVVHRLGDQEALVPLLEDLGRRHADYGVLPEHFEAVGHQLLETLEALSGPTWNDNLRRAWAHAYDRIAHVMVRGLDAATGRITATQELVPPTQWNLPVGPPLTLHARSGQTSIAYQVVGSAPLDLLVVPDFVSNLELCWECPRFAAFLRRLSSFARLILIDRRGTGLSDRAPGALSLDEQLGDLDAVLDAVEVDRAAILCLGAGAGLGAAYAAMRPDRSRALILHGAALRDPHGLDAAAFITRRAAIRSAWGEPLFLETLAPSAADDPELRDWWARYLRASAGASAAEAVHALNAELDLRTLLPAIHTPTLVLHREGDRTAPIADARLIAAMIAGATARELEGADHLPFLGDAEATVSAIHHFLAAMPEVPAAAPRLVTTVALAVHDPDCVATVRALFTRALASAGALAIDSEAMTAELGGVSLVTLTARTLLATSKLLGLPVSAAVITDSQSQRDTLGHQDRALQLARATAPGRLGLNALARELSRGGRAVIGEDEPLG
jgi:serine/threonine protein kinase/pimeloyl-ACP methyl ester carboxylesterase